MGLLEKLGFGAKRLAAGELVEALLAAHRRGDARQFGKLCRNHIEVIEANIPRFQKPPEPITQDPEKLNGYMQTMGAAAGYLRELGHPKFMNALVGDPEKNPITLWEGKIKEAFSLANEFRYEEGAELLINHLIDTRHLKGGGANHLQAKSQGSLGHIRFNAGKVDMAVGHYEQALRLCREQQDVEGVRVYLSTLHESHRYLGNREPAADYAKELSQAYGVAGNQALERRYAKLSQIVRDGEPLLRVVADCDGNVSEIDEVEIRPTMKLEIHFWRNRPALPGVTKRIQRGKELAGKQQYDDALELFRTAAQVDPFEPDAHYHAGMTLCEQRLYPQAIEFYEMCETLAPGWFFCRSDLWLARQLALGAIPHEVFLGLRFMQDGPPNANERMKVATRIRPQANSIPCFALLFGQLIAQAGRPKEAFELWREALQHDVDADVQTRLLFALAQLEEDRDRRRQLLQEAVELNGNLVAAAGAALALRQPT